ncbi:hypothetical protein SAMN05192560_0044 [Methylobacillus rhizosphaerae]|uniref:Uncharacterized protein n=1 Tax=Methylobacillus rhizosphaerae TaxID=551994 RepID=A0A238XMA9_9PROT|nr:hypothetical protein [Methylobacillus rhizosphaerae]SNR60146.1 hypothetical protein SAMN05192560_0044 [Methylobacillus rhizosphaerae]
MTSSVQNEDPGKKLGIIALLLSVFCVPLMGVVVGILAFFKSRSAGHSNLFAILAIIINLIYTVLLLFFLVSIFYVSKAALEQRKQEDALETLILQQQKEERAEGNVDTDRIAEELQAKLEMFHQEYGVYPSYGKLLSERGPLILTEEQREVLVNTATPRSTRVGFQACVASNGVSSGVMLRPGSGNTPLIAGDCSNIAARRE